MWRPRSGAQPARAKPRAACVRAAARVDKMSAAACIVRRMSHPPTRRRTVLHLDGERVCAGAVALRAALRGLGPHAGMRVASAHACRALFRRVWVRGRQRTWLASAPSVPRPTKRVPPFAGGFSPRVTGTRTCSRCKRRVARFALRITERCAHAAHVHAAHAVCARRATACGSAYTMAPCGNRGGSRGRSKQKLKMEHATQGPRVQAARKRAWRS